MLVDDLNDGANSDFNLIKNALSITSMDDLVNYSFTSSEDSTSRDILSVWQVSDQGQYNLYSYNVSGDIVNQDYSAAALTFTRRT